MFSLLSAELQPAMELDPDKFRMAVELAQHCLLPEFDRDIGDQPLERDDFNVFVYGLNESLRLLFDIVAKNDQFLFKINEETETFRTNFILLLNEQSGYDDAPFQTDDQFLLQHIRKLVDKYYQNILRDKRIFDKCLDFYKSRLTVSKWKRNIGAVYGYGRLCEVSSAIGFQSNNKFSKNKFIRFFLSCFSYTLLNSGQNFRRTIACSCYQLA